MATNQGNGDDEVLTSNLLLDHVGQVALTRRSNGLSCRLLESVDRVTFFLFCYIPICLCNECVILGYVELKFEFRILGFRNVMCRDGLGFIVFG